MYFLRVEANFSAALYLSNCEEVYKGMHGHDFNVAVVLKSESLNSSGMVYNYNEVLDLLNNIADSLNHSLLNDYGDFIEVNPTVENLSKFFYDQLNFSVDSLPIHEVEVSQSRGYSAIFRPSN